MDRIPGEALLEEAGEDGEEGVEVVAAVDGEEVVVVVDGEEGVEDGEVDHGEEDPEEVGEVEQETIPTERREVSFRHKQCFFCKKPLVELYFSFSIEKKDEVNTCYILVLLLCLKKPTHLWLYNE